MKQLGLLQQLDASAVGPGWILAILLSGAALGLGPGLLAAPETEAVADADADADAQVAGTEVIHLRLDSIVHPVAAEFIEDAILEADRRGVEALVIELNTPGGLLTSTRAMARSFLGAQTPVVVYVSPQGSQAASAGFFLLMAADVAAMAPGTNTGAAHPVGGGGQDIEGVIGEKVEQDSAAWIRSLAAEQGRNQELAEAAVIESRSFTADEALEQGLIDLVADDLDALLAALDGREVEKRGRSVTLRTAAANVELLEMTLFQRLRSTIANPDVALALASIGGTALIVELWNPGAILPGVIGAICLILAGYGLSILPVSWTGIALLVLAAVLFGLEIKVQSFGVLTAGGVASLVLGSLFLFKSPDPAIRVSLQMIVAMATLSTAVVIFLMAMVLRAQRNPVRSGHEALIAERGVARTAIDPRGKVSIHGEIWNAVAKKSIGVGDEVEVVAVDGMTLKIKAARS